MARFLQSQHLLSKSADDMALDVERKGQIRGASRSSLDKAGGREHLLCLGRFHEGDALLGIDLMLWALNSKGSYSKHLG